MRADVDAPSSDKWTRRQILGLFQQGLEAYRLVCPEHPLFRDPELCKCPAFIVSVPHEVKETKFGCCPSCKAKVNVHDRSCTNSQCEVSVIAPEDLEYTSTFKNGAHGVGWMEWDAMGRLIPEKSAPILTTHQHLIVVNIFNILWQQQHERDPGSVPPYVPEADWIDRNIFGSLRSKYNGAIRVDGAPKVKNCFCANPALKIDECANCGSSKLKGIRRKIIVRGRRYVPVFVLCADGTVHEQLTRQFNSFEEVDGVVNVPGSGYVAGMMLPARHVADASSPPTASTSSATIQVCVESVGEEGQVSCVRIPNEDAKAHNGMRFRLASFGTDSTAAEITVVDDRYAKTLALFRASIAFMPDNAPLTTFKVPDDFMVPASTEVISEKGKQPVGVVRVETDVGVRYELTHEALGGVQSVACASTQPSFDHKLYRDCEDISFDDPRTKAIKQILLDLWPTRYNENTNVLCKHNNTFVKDAARRDVESLNSRRKTSVQSTCFVYANISGHGAKMCCNAKYCKHGLLRKRYSDRPDLSGQAVCSECRDDTIGWHKSSKQFLTFKASLDALGKLDVRVKLCCRSKNAGYFRQKASREKRYMCCSRSAHEAKYGKRASFDEFPANVFKMQWIDLTGASLREKHEKNVNILFGDMLKKYRRETNNLSLAKRRRPASAAGAAAAPTSSAAAAAAEAADWSSLRSPARKKTTGSYRGFVPLKRGAGGSAKKMLPLRRRVGGPALNLSATPKPVVSKTKKRKVQIRIGGR